MFVGDFQSESSPVHKLFQYSGGWKNSAPDKISDVVPMIWLVVSDR